MSVLVSDLITRAGVKIGDPGFRRTSRTDFLQFFNEVQFKIATEIRCLEVDADFNIVADQYLYDYPDEAVGMTGVRFSETPTDINTFRWLREKFTDEWRMLTTPLRPSGNVWAYYARPHCFELSSTPTLAVTNGGIASYWIHPAWLNSESSAVLEIPDFTQEFVMEGMTIHARLTGRDRVAAAQDEKRWLDSLVNLREKIEDRSDDRRPALRPPSYGNPYGGMT